MTIDHKIAYQKLQCDRDNREAVKMSALLLGKTFLPGKNFSGKNFF